MWLLLRRVINASRYNLNYHYIIQLWLLILHTIKTADYDYCQFKLLLLLYVIIIITNVFIVDIIASDYNYYRD